MIYMAMGYLHAAIERRLRRIQTLLASESGQGTVEYVGLILLVSLLMVGMVAAMKGFNRYTSKGGYYRQRRTASVTRINSSACRQQALAGRASNTVNP